jgi:uncharacterized membrane protein YoaK (UPF0700 family)
MVYIKMRVMFNENKTFVIYTVIGIVIGGIIGSLVSLWLGNFQLWASLLASIGALSGIAFFYYRKSGS